jgi:DNA polymerase III delta subunit
MSNKKYNQIMMEAYRQYSEKSARKLFKSNTYQEFIDKCKTDSKFSEKWGLKIEERELSDDELNIFNLFKQNPTKLITITYNNETIEIYE